MVERLKAAIEKARERREALSPDAREGATTPARRASEEPGPAWTTLPERTLDAAALRRRRIMNFERDPRYNPPFDLLRTRLLRICGERGWRRIGVTSPTKGCGKTMLTANLSFSLARQAPNHVLVLDVDLRAPSLGRILGVRPDAPLTDVLSGAADYGSCVVKIADRLAVGLNESPVVDAAERLQAPATATALSRMLTALNPRIVLYDLPPMLAGDETIGFLDKLDAVLMVAAAGETTAKQIEECERLLADAAPLIGVVLNKCEEPDFEGYQYDYAGA